MTKYKVTAKVGYAGHQPGDEFDANLTPDQERRAIERGAIKPVKDTSKPKAPRKGAGDA